MCELIINICCIVLSGDTIATIGRHGACRQSCLSTRRRLSRRQLDLSGRIILAR